MNSQSERKLWIQLHKVLLGPKRRFFNVKKTKPAFFWRKKGIVTEPTLYFIF